jgi:chromosome segregation ATPase
MGVTRVAHFLMAAAFLSCAPYDAEVSKVTPPKEQAPVKPAVERARVPIDEATRSAARMSSELSQLRRQLYQTRKSAEEFDAMLEEERKKGLDAQGQLALVWDQLKATENNLFLQIGLVESMETSNQELQSQLESARFALTEALQVAAIKDEEAIALRMDLMTANDRIGVANEKKEEFKKELEGTREALAKAEVYKHWVIVGICVLIGFWLIREILPLALRKFATGGIG